jgi:phosphate transport system substrate-binding protein
VAILAFLVFGPAINRSATSAGTAAQPTVAAATAAPGTTPAATPAATVVAVDPRLATPIGGQAFPLSPIRVSGGFPGEAQQLRGVGATLPDPLYRKWFEEYAKLTGVSIAYDARGSGAGITAIQEQQSDFGASDAYLIDSQLQQARGGEVVHIPTAVGAVVAAYNIPNFTARLRLNSDTLAGIFKGEIKRWNDPRLVADNPGLANVNQEIIRVVRSDSSGTTGIFTDYLAAANESWKREIGAATLPKWPAGVLLASGNATLVQEIGRNPYSIGYTEYKFAVDQKLTFAAVKNRAGNYVTPSIDTVSAAAEGALGRMPADLRVNIVDAEGAQAYPISGLTYLLFYREMPDRAKAIALTRWAWWGITDGQRYARELEYGPLPSGLVARAQARRARRANRFPRPNGPFTVR